MTADTPREPVEIGMPEKLTDLIVGLYAQTPKDEQHLRRVIGDIIREARAAGLREAPLREALERARNDLLAYGQHYEGEVVLRGADWAKHHRPGELCRCGLELAIAKASAALGDQPQSERERRALQESPDDR